MLQQRGRAASNTRAPFALYAFEPTTECISALKKNIPNLKIFKIALNNKKQKKLFYYNSYWSRDNSLSVGKTDLITRLGYKTKNIKTDRLDNLLSKKSLINKNIIVKMDCEGHEYKSLIGFGNIINIVKYFLIDVGESNNNQENSMQIKELLKNFKVLKKNKDNIVFQNNFL